MNVRRAHVCGDVGKRRAYQKVEHTEAEHIKCETNVTIIVERVQHLNAQTAKETEIITIKSQQTAALTLAHLPGFP